MIVVDTNVMARLLLGGEGGADAALLFETDPEWVAPIILISELRNVLLGYVRRGGLTSDQAKAMIDDAAMILGDRIATVASGQVFDGRVGVRPHRVRRGVRRSGTNLGCPAGYIGQCNSGGGHGCSGVVTAGPGAGRKTRRAMKYPDIRGLRQNCGHESFPPSGF